MFLNLKAGYKRMTVPYWHPNMASKLVISPDAVFKSINLIEVHYLRCLLIGKWIFL